MTKTIKPAMIQGADKVVATAKFLVPVDTGELRGTIRHSGVKPSRNGNPMIEITAGDESTVVGEGKKFQLARIIEFGTNDEKNPARPFLKPAFRRHSRSIRLAIRKAMRQSVKIANGG